MAIPLSADRLLEALRAEGAVVVEHGGWRTHNRGSRGAGWGPVHGVMIHHTVTSGSDTTVRILRDGYSGLPGPLCHLGVTKDGRVHLIGHGRANHAGAGDDDVLRAVVREDSRLPAPNETNTDGNARFYGVECENLGDGRDPWPEEQLDAVARAAAAVCRAHGWQAESVIGHAQWRRGKVDPRGPGKSASAMMRGLRGRVAELLDHPPGWGKKEDTMLSDSDVQRIADRVLNGALAAVLQTDGVIKRPQYPKPAADETNLHWRADSYLRHTYEEVRKVRDAVARLAAAGAARDAVLARLAEGAGLTGDEITAAAEAGARAALAELGQALTDGSDA